MLGSDILKKAQFLVFDNSTTILTGIGVAGTVTTAVLTGRASFKAAQIITEEANKVYLESDGIQTDLSLGDKIKMVWPQFIPPAGVGALTIGAIVFSNRLSSKETAAMALAYGMSEKKFEEYRDKVAEKMGLKKETDVRDEIAQDRVNANPPDSRTVIITGSGEVLCYDTLTDRYFQSTAEEIKRAETAVNMEIVNHDSVPLSRFYDHVGLMATPYSEDVGWNIDNKCEVNISAVVSKDNRPCLSLDFASWPKPNYDKVWP